MLFFAGISTRGNKMKKDIVAPELYTEEYYLTDNEGCREFIKDLDNNVHDKFERIFELVNVKKNDTILDIGCGRGELVYYCVKKGAIGYGIDYSQNAIDIANKTKLRLPKELQAKVFFKKNTAEEFSYPQKYDYIFMIEVAEHMYDWQLKESFKRIKSALKPEGIVIITTPNYLYESFLQPIKMFFELPFRFLKLLFRIPRGKYKPKSLQSFLKLLFRFRPNRGEVQKQRHANIMTPSRLKELLKDFDTDVFCEDHSLHILSLILKRWCGRQIIAIARLKR